MRAAYDYDEIADWYDAQVRDSLLPFHTVAIAALLELMGDIHGQEVCDLACGQGILSRELARRASRASTSRSACSRSRGRRRAPRHSASRISATTPTD
jgi:ubiquinone/menaquinone biosynthesis C-methylase UbiE